MPLKQQPKQQDEIKFCIYYDDILATIEASARIKISPIIITKEQKDYVKSKK